MNSMRPETAVPAEKDTVAPVAPDLQALVARFGGYHRIPPEAWAQHDQELAAYQAWLRRK